jgi:hypothetical protein
MCPGISTTRFHEYGLVAMRKWHQYLARLCACRACHLTSGFEIQQWAFVPKANIFLEAALGTTSANQEPDPLDFKELSSSALASYQTSKDHVRHFC